MTWTLANGGGPHAKRAPNDYYATPAPVGRVLLEREGFTGPILEPCAGRGHLVRELERHGYRVWSNEPFPQDFQVNDRRDFLSYESRGGCQSLVTNPPFKLAERFIRHAIQLGFKQHAWLLRWQFAEARYDLFKDYPPARIWVFSKRIQLGEWGLKRPIGGAICFAWWVWDWNCDQAHPEIRWIPPDAISPDEVTP